MSTQVATLATAAFIRATVCLTCDHGWMDGEMDGWMDVQMDTQMDGWMDVQMDSWLDGGLMVGWTNGWIAGRRDG